MLLFMNMYCTHIYFLMVDFEVVTKHKIQFRDLVQIVTKKNGTIQKQKVSNVIIFK